MYGLCSCPMTTNRWMLDHSSARAEECANSVESLWAERCRQQQMLFNPSAVNRDVEFSASLDVIQRLSHGFRPDVRRDTTQLVEPVELVAVLVTAMLSLIILCTIVRNWVTSRYPKSQPPKRIPALDAFQSGQGARDIANTFDDVDYDVDCDVDCDVDYDADDSDSSSEAEILSAVIDSADYQCGVILVRPSDQAIGIEKNREKSAGSEATSDSLGIHQNTIFTGADPVDPADAQRGVVLDFTDGGIIDSEKSIENSTESQGISDVSGLHVDTILTGIDPIDVQCGIVVGVSNDETIEIEKKPNSSAGSRETNSSSGLYCNAICAGTDPVDPPTGIVLDISADRTSGIKKSLVKAAGSQGASNISHRNTTFTGIDPVDSQSGMVFDASTVEIIEIEKNPQKSDGSQEIVDSSGFHRNTIFTEIDPVDLQCRSVLVIPADDSTGIEKIPANTVGLLARDSGVHRNAEDRPSESSRTAGGRPKDAQNSIVTVEDILRNPGSDVLDVSIHCDVDPDELRPKETATGSGIPSAAAFSHPEMFLRCVEPCQGFANNSSSSSSECLPNVSSHNFAHLYKNAFAVEDIPPFDSAVVHTVVVCKAHSIVNDAGDARDAESDGSFHSIPSSRSDWFTASSDEEVASDSFVTEKHHPV